MPKPKILYTIYSEGFAGTERQLHSLCKYLSSDFDITVACPKSSAINDKFKDIDVSIVNFNFSFYCLFKLVSFIKRGGFQIIHNNLGKAIFIGTFAAACAGIKNIVTTRHFLKPNYAFSNNYFKKIMYPFLYRLVVMLNIKTIAASEAIRQSIIKREHVPPGKIITISNGADILHNDPKQTSGFKIGTVSRLSKEKGLEFLIDAMPVINKECPQAVCEIAGVGQLEDELKKLVMNRGLQDKIKFVGYLDNIASFIDSLDIFVLSAIEEPFGLAVIEAQLRGKVVIACDSGGPKEIIINGKSGLLVPPMDVNALGEGVVSLFKDREYAYNLAVAGQRRALELYTAEVMGENTKKLYLGLLKK